MIAKIAKSSSNFFAVAHYHQNKIDKENQKLMATIEEYQH